MVEALIRKLEGFGPLPEDDKAFVRNLKVRARDFAPRTDIISEGDDPSDVHLVETGFAFRYKDVESGKRQIVGLLVPGDLCDLHVFILKAMDHNIAAQSPTRVVLIPRESILDLLERPSISKALLMATLVDEATLRDWIANIGQRNADARIGHFFCELHARLKVVGLTSDGRLSLPLTQTQLGETLGLSTVHINRSLQSLRERDLVLLKRGMLEIPDIYALQQMSGYRSNYLHLGESGLNFVSE